MKSRINLVNGCCSLLVLLFVYTAVSKFLDMEEFRRQLANQSLPSWTKKPLTGLIPVSEILVSLALLRPGTRKTGLYGAALLMALFTGYMGLVLVNAFDRVPCSCGGVFRSMSFEIHFAFNLFFLLLAVTGIYFIHFHSRTIIMTSKK